MWRSSLVSVTPILPPSSPLPSSFDQRALGFSINWPIEIWIFFPFLFPLHAAHTFLLALPSEQQAS